MNLLAPAALALGTMVVPLLVLYMLRSKRHRTAVSSTYLWDRLGEPVSSAVPWQRLRITPLLLAQLAVLALFVFLLARPFFLQETVLGPHTVFIIDNSGSMGMAGRLDRAVNQAVDLAGDVSEANLVSVVEAGPVPRVLAAFSQDRDAVVAALRSLRPSGGVEDLPTALRLARGLETPDRPTRIVFFSDGGGVAGPPLEEPVAGAEHLLFDDIGENLAITAFSTDPSAEGVTRVFLEVSNLSERQRTATIDFAVAGLPVGSSEMELAPMERARATVPIEAGAGDVVTATIRHDPGGSGDGGGDALPLDDTAHLMIGTGPDRTVELAGRPSFFMEALVGAAPGFRAADEGREPDVIVVDGGGRPSLDRPAWVIRTAEPPQGIEVTELAQNLAVTWQRPGDPLLDGVDLSEVVVGEAQLVDAPGWLPLVRAGDVPLVLLGEVGGRRTVYFTFDVAHSNLPVKVAFPILGARLLEWLAGSSSSASLVEIAGAPIALTPPPGAVSLITMPDGTVREMAASVDLFDATTEPGIYHVSYRRADGEEVPGPVAVRRFAPDESLATSRTIATAPGPGGTGERGSLAREWAPWLAATLLLLVLAEWWLGHRRPRRRSTLIEPDRAEEARV